MRSAKREGCPPALGCLLQCRCALLPAGHDSPVRVGEHQDGGCGWCSARGCPALRQAPDPRVPRRRGCFAPCSAGVGCLWCVCAVYAVSAWCLTACESTCPRASLARDTTSNGEEVVSGAEAASSAGRIKCRAASAARRRRLRGCEMIRRMYFSWRTREGGLVSPPRRATRAGSPAARHEAVARVKTGVECEGCVAQVELLRRRGRGGTSRRAVQVGVAEHHSEVWKETRSVLPQEEPNSAPCGAVRRQVPKASSRQR